MSTIDILLMRSARRSARRLTSVGSGNEVFDELISSAMLGSSEEGIGDLSFQGAGGSLSDWAPLCIPSADGWEFRCTREYVCPTGFC